MSRRIVLAIVFVALTTGACGSTKGRVSRRPARHAPSERVAKVERQVARDVVEREVQAVWATPADGAPVAIAADTRGEVVIIDRERVGALDPRGRVLWATDLDGVVGAVPVLMDDRVIVPFTRANGSGGCAGLDRETGKLRWRYEAITTGGVAVAQAGTLAICLMQNGQTVGIAIAWGSPLWEFTYAGDVDPSTIEVPAGTAIAVDQSNGMFAFVAQLGARWELTIRSIETGHTRAFHDLGAAGAPSAPALIADGYLAVASDDGDLELVRVKTRESVRFPIPAADGFDPASPPLRVDGLVIVAARAGEVTAFDLGSERPRWTAHAAGPLRGVHPVVVGNVVMVQTWSGELCAFRLSDGTPVRLAPDPGRAIAMLSDAGREVAFAVGQDGDAGWIERWEAQPDR